MLPVKMALPVMMLLVAEILHSWAMLWVKATWQVKASLHAKAMFQETVLRCCL